MIAVQDLRKHYRDAEVLGGVSLTVASGEVFGFVGPNGAGKTTFLKCLLGIARADGGDIRLGPGEQATVDARLDSLAARRLCAYAPSETAMYDHLRVDAMLRFALSFYADADLEQGRALLARFTLPPRRKVGALSHGMKRKLLLAQALASGSPILLLDEPMEGLDPEARRDLEGLLREQAKRGRTVFFSSHDLASVERVCDRVAFLRDGKLLACDTVDAILERMAHVLRLHLHQPLQAADLPQAENLSWSGAGTRWQLAFTGELADVLPHLSKLPLAGLRDASGGLEDVFETLYGGAAT